MTQIAQIEERVPLLPNFTKIGKEPPLRIFLTFTAVSCYNSTEAGLDRVHFKSGRCQNMAGNTKKLSEKDKAKKLAIRIVCLVLAVSMVIGTVCVLISYLIGAFK